MYHHLYLVLKLVIAGILLAACSPNVGNVPLDSYSSLYQVNPQQDKKVHVRSMGLEHQGPAVILLSGFNKNYHSDSAWFALLQPLIAKTHRVHAIERFGSGFSSDVSEPSFFSFAPALDKTLTALNEDSFIIVSFASSNILALAWQNLPESQVHSRLKGMVWIDPDILLEHSVSLYQDYPVAWYREQRETLIPHLQKGNWTQRTIDKLAAEREEIASLVPQDVGTLMDWSYFDLISQRRAAVNKQVTRAKEIMNYYDDLNTALKLDINTSVPITIIDSDFESEDIKSADPEFVDGLMKWQQEGSAWSKSISKRSKGIYMPINNSDHMVIFQNPSLILKALDTFE